MYIPAKYKITDIEEVRSFIQTNSFGILINILDEKPWATHIPLELETNNADEEVLVGHISKGNPQWKAFVENPQVMAIFAAPHAYISSSWYDADLELHRRTRLWTLASDGRRSIISGFKKAGGQIRSCFGKAGTVRENVAGVRAAGNARNCRF